jgi:starch phosphorylase
MGGVPVRQEMKCIRQLDGTPGGCLYGAMVSAARPLEDYAIRVIPHYDGVAIPLENQRIVWQR